MYHGKKWAFAGVGAEYARAGRAGHQGVDTEPRGVTVAGASAARSLWTVSTRW
jgi:hypothetical protein